MRPRRSSFLLILLAGCAHQQIQLRPDASTSEWIEDALDRLPLVLTHPHGERIRVIWHAERRPFGTGESDDEIVDLEANAIHVYGMERPSKRAVQRAVAFSLVWALDLEARWSTSPDWMVQNGWRAALTSLFVPFEHAQNLDPRGFADERGQASARADLASFAAHYFFPDPKDDVRCRLLSQARFLAERLRLPERKCRGFERWARIEEIDTIELGMAAPTTRAAGSLFGHLFLRVLYQSGESRVIAFLADVRGEIEDDPFYAIKGLFGGYRARLMEKSFEDIYRDYVVVEGRDLRRWRVNFDEEETTTLLERIWTLERSGAFGYYFLSQNCASLLVGLFNSVLPEDRRIDHAGAIGRGPGAALDGFAFATNGRGEPLITYVPDPIRSFAREAREAEGRRTELAAELASTSPEAAAAFATIESADPDARADGYRRLAGADLPAPAVDRYLIDSLAVESHLQAARNTELEEAKFEERSGRRAAVIAAFGESLPLDLALASAEPQLASLLDEAIELLASLDPLERRLGYEAMLAFVSACGVMHESSSDPEIRRRLRMVVGGARLFALLIADRSFDPKLRDLFFVVPGVELGAQPYVGSFRELIEYTYVTEVAAPVLAIARARKRIGGQRLPDRGQEIIAREELRYERAYPHTGIDVLSIRGSNRGLVIGGALYDEALGDRRRHGFPADTALMVGASDVVWSWRDGRPSVVESRTRLVGYRTLRSAFDVIGPLLSKVGFELALDLETMRDEQRWIRGEAKAGVLVPLLASDDLSSHLLAKVGLSGLAWLVSDAADAGGVGLPVGLELRAELGPVIANVDVGVTPLIEPTRGQIRLTGAALGRVRVPIYDRLVLPWRGHVGISLEASARLGYSEIPDADGIFVRVDAGVRIE